MYKLFSDTEMEMTVDERERLSFLGKSDEKKKKEKKAKKRTRKDCDEDKMDDNSKNKFAKLQKEMDEMRKKILILTSTKETPPVSQASDIRTYALGFSPEEYLSQGFIASANWISEKIAKNMRDRMSKMEERWKAFKQIKNAEYNGVKSIVPCVTFNRGEGCRLGIWHTTLKKYSNNESDLARRLLTREELRVHCCTLCLKALGVICMHSVIDCPWILEENWA